MKDRADAWPATVSDLMGMFRDSLVALVPIMDRAHIAWMEEKAYDQWDTIAATLYTQVVVDAISAAVAPATLKLPQYDLAIDDYSRLSVLQGAVKGDPDHLTGVFHRFVTTEQPFDTVELVQLDESGHRIDQKPVYKQHRATEYQLHLLLPNGSRSAISNLLVPD